MIIYKTTNLVNGKIYIGQDSNNNPNYLGSGKLLKYAISKYGIENFKLSIAVPEQDGFEPLAIYMIVGEGTKPQQVIDLIK